MKKKITIALDEKILKKIDKEVDQNRAKNRSAAIESHLIKYYGDFTDTSAIIFCHDNKWDNREYPFDTPKSLLVIRDKSIILRQIEIFLNIWIKDIHISIPTWTSDIFKKELNSHYPQHLFYLYELTHNIKTWDALTEIMTRWSIWETIFISNWDNFYGSLNLWKYYEFHKKQDSDFSFCLKFVMTPEQLWNVVIQWEKIIDFVEKPKAQATYLTNSGLYITSKNYLKSQDYGSHLETDFFPYIPSKSNVVWFLYSWEWEHIQNDSTFERVNGELI